MRWLRYWELLVLLPFLLGAGCSTFQVKPEPTPSASPSPVTSPSPSASPAPIGQESFTIYYGNPNEKKEPWGAVRVVAEDWQFTENDFYPQVKQILAAARLGCGYIPLGREPNASVMYEYGKYTKWILIPSQFQADIVRWKAAGANCIFVDTAGKDYDNDEARVMAAWKLIHDAGMQVVWNAWEPGDLPWSKFTSTDHFLFENFENLISHPADEIPRLALWMAKHPVGSRAYAVVEKPLSGSDRAKVETAVLKYGLSGVQYRKDDDYEHE